MKESDMFEYVKSWLLNEMGCSDVYGEVLDIDVLGLHGPVNFVVEMKKNLSFKLLDQALYRSRLGQYVYIAIPERKTPIPKSVSLLLEQHNIGLLLIKYNRSWGYYVEPKMKARFNRIPSNYVHYVRSRIEDFHDYQIGGKRSGETMTVYKRTMQNVKRFLWIRRDRWVKIDEILDYCETHWASPKPSLAKSLKDYEHAWCDSTKIKNRLHFKYNESGDLTD